MNKKIPIVLKFVLCLIFIFGAMVFVYITTDIEAVRSFILNVTATLVGFLLTAFIFQRILSAYNNITELKKINVVAVQFNKVLQGYIDVFADIFKSVSLEAKEYVPEELEDFFGKEFYELIEDFDWNSDGPTVYDVDYDKNIGHIFHRMPWHEYLNNKFKKLEHKYDNLFTKYSTWMTEDMLNQYAQLLDIELSARIKTGKKFENFTYKMERQAGTIRTMLRFPLVCPLNAVVEIMIQINNYNKKHFPNITHLTINPKLWINNTAPSIGQSRISIEDECRYGPKDLINILNKQGGPIRI